VAQLPLSTIAFLQASGVAAYCVLVSTIFSNGNRWFGPDPKGMLAPALFLGLFSVSAVICALIFLGYPFLLFWEHKQAKKALFLVLHSTLWLAGFVVLGFLSLALF